MFDVARQRRTCFHSLFLRDRQLTVGVESEPEVPVRRFIVSSLPFFGRALTGRTRDNGLRICVTPIFRGGPNRGACLVKIDSCAHKRNHAVRFRQQIQATQ